MEVKEARGRLGVLIPGLGAVATTLIAGVEAVKKGIAQPIGSLTQMGHIHLNRKAGDNYPKIKEFVPLANLGDLVFGGKNACRNGAGSDDGSSVAGAVCRRVVQDRGLSTSGNGCLRKCIGGTATRARYLYRVEATPRSNGLYAPARTRQLPQPSWASKARSQ